MDFDSDPNGWAIALAVIGFGGVALEQVRYFLKSGVAIIGPDRADKREDPANYWTILALFSAVGILFAAVGFWLITRLVARGAPLVWWTAVSIAWGFAILVAHRTIWNRESSRAPRRVWAAKIFTPISHVLLLLAMVSFLGTARGSASPKSVVPTAPMPIEVHEHGAWYVTPHAASLSHANEFLMLFMTFPWLAVGVSVGWLRYRERRIKSGERV